MKNHNYKRICKLGKGSFGDVQLIEKLDSRTLYALKRLDVSHCELPAVLNEVCLLQQLEHPNIIKYHEYFKESNKICIVMEYADNGDLYNQVLEAKKEKRNLPEATIINWFTQLCLALHYLHKRHVIHRDIKLQNVFLTKESLIKLGDFGVSKKLDNTDDLAKTSLGTPYYISPEICQGKPYNHKSDVWMLGCVLYELCTLERAFDAYSLHTLVKKIVEEGHQKIGQKYSLFIKELIDEMLEKEPEKRPKISQILEKPEIRKEISKLAAKYPRIYSGLAEAQPDESIRRDNKSISFHDYLIKKRNIPDQEKALGSNIRNINGNNAQMKKNAIHQTKLSTINLNYGMNSQEANNILARKISLPNEIQCRNLDNSTNLEEKSTVKNARNEFNVPLQAYFFNNKTPNFKNNQAIYNHPPPRRAPAFELKTPQHNLKRQPFLLNINLDSSEILNNNCDSRADSSRLMQFDGDRQKTLENSVIIDESQFYSHKSNRSKLQEYFIGNKENQGYLGNLVNPADFQKTRGDDSKQAREKSYHDINVSFEDASKADNSSSRNQRESFIQTFSKPAPESLKRSISVHLSSPEGPEAPAKSPSQSRKKATKFSEFLRQNVENVENKSGEKPSFVDFLEKRTKGLAPQAEIKENREGNLKELMVKMFGEENVRALFGALRSEGAEGRSDAERVLRRK